MEDLLPLFHPGVIDASVRITAKPVVDPTVHKYRVVHIRSEYILKGQCLTSSPD